MLRCHALGRLIDPCTHKCLAAYGWLSTDQYQARYWVSVESDAYQFFNNKRDARKIYRQASDRIQARAAGRPKKRRRRHNQPAALAGGKEKYAA